MALSLKQIYVTLAMALGVIILAVAGFTSWYTVDESEQAVVITFGKASDPITEPGLKFKLPWPIQSVKKLSKETFSLQFGYTEVDGEVVSVEEEETKMSTGDETIVLADMVVQWRITDPAKYLFNVDNPDRVLKSSSSA